MSDRPRLPRSGTSCPICLSGSGVAHGCISPRTGYVPPSPPNRRDDPHDHRTPRPMTRPPSTEDLEREWAPVDRAIDDALGTPRWHEIATEGLPPTWTFVSTWDAECPNGGVGYLQLHLPDDAEDENAAPVWHDDHGHRADRGVTHWYPLPAPPTKEPR